VQPPPPVPPPPVQPPQRYDAGYDSGYHGYGRYGDEYAGERQPPAEHGYPGERQPLAEHGYVDERQPLAEHGYVDERQPPPGRGLPGDRMLLPEGGYTEGRRLPPASRHALEPAPDEGYERHYDDGYEREFEGDPRDGLAPQGYEGEYEDDLDEDDRAEPEYIEDERPDGPRSGKRGKRALGWVAAVAVIALLAGGAWYGIDTFFGYDDYDGNGESDVLIEIADGDSTNAIAAKLTNAGVVASAKAFVRASESNTRVLSVQPGFYVLKTKMSGDNAAAKLVEPTSRVGQLQIRGGTQLDDIKQPDGKTTDGVLSQLAKASCTDLNGHSTCVPVEALRKAAETADLAALGVPEWAVSSAARTEGARRIEGLIVPGVYDVRPGAAAPQLLESVLRTSAQRLQAAGLPAAAGTSARTPYQVLVIASLIEREGVRQDFGKVSRVIYNRLTKNMKLELDSTVNYILDRPVVRTRPEDRARAGAYNTYQNTGLPPTPISAPSKEAIQAAEKPAEGAWLFFVKCDKSGLSCFAETNDEHEQNKRDALARGAY
jgi:UPF0755 protein